MIMNIIIRSLLLNYLTYQVSNDYELIAVIIHPCPYFDLILGSLLRFDWWVWMGTFDCVREIIIFD